MRSARRDWHPAISSSGRAFERRAHFPKVTRNCQHAGARLAADKCPFSCPLLDNGLGQYPVPRDAYYMSGAGGQTTLIIPSHDLVVVCLGHYRGDAAGALAFRNALRLLMEAVPRRN
jgi:hypothetical protein